MTSKLIKCVSKVDFQFNPLDIRAVSARELFRQLDSGRFYKNNPKLKLNLSMPYTPDPPIVKLEYINGEVLELESKELKTDEMMLSIFQKAQIIDYEYEMDGKPIE